MARRYAPTPVPQDDNQPLRQWLDENNRRIVAAQPDAAVEGFALLYGGADAVAANDTTETPILNYALSANLNSGMAIDSTLGTITLPNKAGLVRISSWITLDQVTATLNFNVDLLLEVNGVWTLLGAAYIPQNAVDAAVGITAQQTRAATGGEVFRWGLLLDGASPATFNVINCSFEVQYRSVRG